MFKDLLYKLSHIGTGSIDNERLRRKIILSNQLALSACLVFIFVSVFFLLFVNPKPALVYFITALSYSLVVLFNKRGNTTISRLFLTIFPASNLMVVSCYTSADVNLCFKFTQLGVIVVPLILFDIKEKFLLSFGILWIVGMFYLTDVVNPYIPLMPDINPATFQQTSYINFNAGLTILFIVISYIYLQRLNIKAEEKIYQLYQETNDQKLEIQRRNKKITDSLNYATYIQKAVLSNTDVLESHCDDHFLVFKPKDIVSGDFYMFKKLQNKLVIIVADGTGHGVPGAFMSMLGISFLTEVLRKSDLADASHTLCELRNQIKMALNQQDFSTNSRDGMDLAMLVIDTETFDAQFTGANRPLLLFKGQTGEMIEFKGDKMPIGIYEKEIDFTNNLFKIEKGDVVYLFSDGYKDQLGGSSGKQFKTKYFRDLLGSIHSLSMTEQKRILESTHTEWRGNEAQTDDILVVGIKV